MLITQNSSPVCGELLDDGAIGGEPSEMPSHLVPESSHTIEIQYISHVPELHIYDSDATVIEDTFSDEPFSGGEFFQQCGNTKICFEYSEEIVANETIVPEYYETNFLPDTPSSSNECSTDSYSCDVNNSVETDLTNLNWLQNITNIMEVPALPVRTAVRKPPPKPLIQNVRLHKLKQTIMKCQEDFLENLEEYQSNGEKKPPYSYSTMICLAMRYNGNKMTLSAIYTWIRENFKYYRTADPSWQNSIRHNLSLNKVFVKVARAKQEPGKGGFWKLDLARLEDPRRYKRAQTSPKASKKKIPASKMNDESKINNDNIISIGTEDGNSFQNDIFDSVKDMNVSMECDLSNQLPDFSLDGLESDLSSPLHDEIGANVIVEPVLEAELGALLLAAPWEDMQPDLLDNFLDSYLK